MHACDRVGWCAAGAAQASVPEHRYGKTKERIKKTLPDDEKGVVIRHASCMKWPGPLRDRIEATTPQDVHPRLSKGKTVAWGILHVSCIECKVCTGSFSTHRGRIQQFRTCSVRRVLVVTDCTGKPPMGGHARMMGSTSGQNPEI